MLTAKQLKALCSILILFLSSSALANPFQKAEKEVGIPEELLVSVAKVESGMRPYAFAVWTTAPLPKLSLYCSSERFIKGKFLYNGCFFKSRKKAESFLTFLLKNPAVENFSVGLMQVNSSWIPVLNINPYDLLDPDYNVLLGALILKFYYDATNDLARALSLYYGKKRGIAVKYVKKVVKNLELSER